MSSRTAPHWASIGETTVLSGIWVLIWINRLLGRLPFRLCLYPVIVYYMLTKPVARRSSMEYLQRYQAATGGLGHAPTWVDSLRHFITFAETILDKILAVSGSYPASQVNFSGREVMLEQIARRGGGVIVTSHTGCLELIRVLSHQRAGLRLTILVHTRHAARINSLLERLDPQASVRFLEVSDMSPATATTLVQRAEAGEFVVVTGDRIPVHSNKTVEVPFLQHMAPFPTGPYVLAALLKCPLFMLTCVHAGAGYHVYFSRLADSVELPRAQRQEAMARYATLYAQELEAILQRSPYDWFNFFPFWDQEAAA